MPPEVDADGLAVSHARADAYVTLMAPDLEGAEREEWVPKVAETLAAGRPLTDHDGLADANADALTRAARTAFGFTEQQNAEYEKGLRTARRRAFDDLPAPTLDAALRVRVQAAAWNPGQHSRESGSGRRQRPTTRSSSASRDGPLPSGDSEDPEPPLDRSPRRGRGVTLSLAQCAACGALLTGRRRQTRTCSAACRQPLFRMCSRKRVTVSPSVETQPPRLSFELRQALRAEIDRRHRAALAEADRDEAKRLLAMFADEVPA